MRALNHGRRVKEYIFHPTERNWGLASAFTLCEDFHGEPCKIYKELFLTKDLGESWTYVESYIIQFDWGVKDASQISAGIPKERILITYEPRGKGHQKTSGWNYKVDFAYSDDFFHTRKVPAHKGNKFMLTKDYLYVAQVVDQENQEVVLLTSKSDHKVYDLQLIETNQKRFREHSYSFLDSSESSVFLNINHFGEASRYGHVYISDSSGVNFSVSLKYNVRTEDNQSDFEKISSLEGIYIGNAIATSFMKDAEQEMEEDEYAEYESMEENHDSSRHMANKHKKMEGYEDFIKTMITFNKGGDWKRIKAPLRDVEGHLYDCGSDCYLNLHGLSNNYPPVYAVESAAGIIIANGNVGRYLTNDEDEVSTFLSRDGGLNWFEIRKGPHIYEIGDHGALIVIADIKTATNTVLYSWDEGLTFEELKISDEKIHITNVIIEPMSTSQHFVVYGETTTKKGVKKGVVIGLDFTGLHEPMCKNPDNPDTPDSDYEKWTPNDGRAGGECLLGRKIIYIRRKRESQCYNGLTFERKIVVENCACTEMDYECDLGFYRPAPGEPCVRTDGVNLPFELHTPPKECHNFYTISKGYRKVPGNTCVNGVKFDPIIIPCPFSGMFASLGFVFLILIVVILIVLVIMAFNKNFFQNVSDIVKEKMQEAKKKNQPDYVNIVKININILGKQRR